MNSDSVIGEPALLNPSFRLFLEQNEYFNLRNIPNAGVCAIVRFMFTVGVLVDIDWHGYRERYCFDSLSASLGFYDHWDGITKPVPGEMVAPQ